MAAAYIFRKLTTPKYLVKPYLRAGRWVWVWLLAGCAQCLGQISPGPLSRAHEQLEGVTHCAACHDFGGHARSFKCLECHVEIQRRLDDHAGYHTRAFRSSAGQADCTRCHMEHNGQKFALISLDRENFDHAAQTGFALEGKHRTIGCEKCHMAKNIPQVARAAIKLKNPSRSFLGLRRECLNCHEDAHRGQEGPDCARCHHQDSWKTAPGFSHANTIFPLTGLHQNVACEKCHASRAEPNTPPLFKGLSYTGCQSCHNDPHHGAFKEIKVQATCESCHNTGGWKGNHPSSNFHHSSTKFMLVGKHAELSCGRCHQDSNFHRPIPHDRCSSCHEDPHKGQFSARVAGSDCSACHNQTSYRPALFDRETHRRSAFPLEGKHATVACADCHPPAGRDTVYLTRKLICSACHSDQHNGQFASTPFENKCDACHKQDGFLPTTFTVARHAQTKFALTGGHTKVDCAECHKPVAIVAAAVPAAKSGRAPTGPVRQYHFTAQTCITCHVDPHQSTLACEGCHTTDRWKTVKRFDHSTTKFQLDRAHQKVTCTECHRAEALAKAPKFPMKSTQCSDCHSAQDVHGGQFLGDGRREDCSACHMATQWVEKTFSHDKTQFPLDVAHRNVTCEKCHKQQRPIGGGKLSRVYRDTSTECVKCH